MSNTYIEKEYVDADYDRFNQIPDEVFADEDVAVVDKGLDEGYKVIRRSNYTL